MIALKGFDKILIKDNDLFRVLEEYAKSCIKEFSVVELKQVLNTFKNII